MMCPNVSESQRTSKVLLHINHDVLRTVHHAHFMLSECMYALVRVFVRLRANASVHLREFTSCVHLREFTSCVRLRVVTCDCQVCSYTGLLYVCAYEGARVNASVRIRGFYFMS
jgi:hypothetical protein